LNHGYYMTYGKETEKKEGGKGQPGAEYLPFKRNRKRVLTEDHEPIN